MIFPSKWEYTDNKERILNSAIKAILKIFEWEGIDHYVIYRLYSNSLTWDLTEALTIDDIGIARKYLGARYWSYDAIEQYKSKKNKDGLKHEHVVERGRIINMLMDSNLNKSLKKRYLDDPNHYPAAIVTSGENSKLNNFGKNRNGWDRYLASEINIYDRKIESELNLKKAQELIDPIVFNYEIKRESHSKSF